MSAQPREEIGWALVELTDGRMIPGYVTEDEVAGEGMLKIDTPAEPAKVEWVSARIAVYKISTMAEADVRSIVGHGREPEEPRALSHMGRVAEGSVT